ncbi:MAG TPA: class I SAM-dependent methyltransferase [Verrucomicrobiae bacterium]|nr:class I SAM-dependent methyltransferase [Verrucomicrobiae bacterium]
MKLPDLSNSMYVARLRHIQSIHELEKHRNPDTQVRHFLPRLQRWKAAWLGREALSQLRAQPFYYYLIARTRYYDQVMLDAVSGGVKRIAMIGCGSDTRAYRFEPILRQHGVRILECDQPQAIHVKARLAKRWHADYVEYQPIDLHHEECPGLARWLAAGAGAKTLVVMEGVSPYVNDQDFCRFLRWLAGKLPPGTAFAYDYKIRGVEDDFGRGQRAQQPFRLSTERKEVANFHQAHGFELVSMELSSELCVRLLPDLAGAGNKFFTEDGLLRLNTASV